MHEIPKSWKVIIMGASGNDPKRGEVLVDCAPSKIYTARAGKDIVFSFPQHFVVLPLAMMEDIVAILKNEKKN